MTAIYLVRHGEAASSWGKARDPGLSDKGRQQALFAAKRLRAFDLNDAQQLLSSPRLRAVQTAEITGELFGQSVDIVDIFQEVPAQVSLDKRAEWIQQYLTAHWHSQDDSILKWRDKAFDILHGYDRPTVIFSHFLLINAVVSRLVGAEETVVFYPDNASITTLSLDKGKLGLVELGRSMADTKVSPLVDVATVRLTHP